MASDLSELLSSLCLSSAADDAKTAGTEDLIEKFKTILAALPDDFEDSPDAAAEVAKSLSSGGLLQHLKLGLNHKDAAIQRAAAEVVAKLAKCETCRCSDEVVSLVPSLMAVQAAAQAQDSAAASIATVIQATRALGNICYEHDAGRVAVLESGGAEAIVSLLQRAITWPDEHNASCKTGCDAEGNAASCSAVQELRVVVTGFLLNLTNSCDKITSALCTSECISCLSRYLEEHCDEEDIPTHVLLALACMADSATGRETLSAVDLSPQICLLLTHSIAPDVIEACLELTTTLAEQDVCKVQFAKGGVCEAVLEVVRRCSASHSSYGVVDKASAPEPIEQKAVEAAEATEASALDESLDESDIHSDFCWQAIIQTATDLIVLILLGDTSMPLIYQDGRGPVFLQLLSWLASGDEQLQVPAALAMGNFARTDGQSMQLVSMGVSVSLLQLLQQHCTDSGRIVVQHAVLAALRNLSIAQPNKRALLMQGALQVLLPLMVTVESYPVVFKLLATLRMIVDGNSDAAIAVGVCVPAVQKLVRWCGVQEHPGVQGEASRLLAALIKNTLAGPPQAYVLQPPTAAQVPIDGSPNNNKSSDTAEKSSPDDSSAPSATTNTSTAPTNTNTTSTINNSGSTNTDTTSTTNTAPTNTETITTNANTNTTVVGADSSTTNSNNNNSPSEGIVVPVGVAVLHSLVEGGCLAPLVNMLRSHYPIMIHEASLALSLCLSVCKNLPGVLDCVDPAALGQGVDNAAVRTALNAPPLPLDDLDEADTVSEGDENSANAAKESDPAESSESVAPAEAAPAESAEPAAPADSADTLSHAMYNLLVACVALTDVAGGVKLLKEAQVVRHFSGLRSSRYEHVSLAATTLWDKTQVS